MNPDVTQLLNALEQGDPHAAEELLPLVYQELRKLAGQRMAQGRPGQTLPPTALVHGTYLRLVAKGEPGWQSRDHFFAAAAEALRRNLVENACTKKRHKYGGERQPQGLDVPGLLAPGLARWSPGSAARSS